MDAKIKKQIDDINSTGGVVIWGLTYCPYCKKAIEILQQNDISFRVMYVNSSPYVDIYKKYLKLIHPTFPIIIFKNKLVGGCDSLMQIRNPKKYFK